MSCGRIDIQRHNWPGFNFHGWDTSSKGLDVGLNWTWWIELESPVSSLEVACLIHSILLIPFQNYHLLCFRSQPFWHDWSWSVNLCKPLSQREHYLVQSYPTAVLIFATMSELRFRVLWMSLLWGKEQHFQRKEKKRDNGEINNTMSL